MLLDWAARPSRARHHARPNHNAGAHAQTHAQTHATTANAKADAKADDGAAQVRRHPRGWPVLGHRRQVLLGVVCARPVPRGFRCALLPDRACEAHAAAAHATAYAKTHATTANAKADAKADGRAANTVNRDGAAQVRRHPRGWPVLGHRRQVLLGVVCARPVPR